MNRQMKQPWFSEKDPVLSVTGIVRDPISRLSIWRSGIGRVLVPCLASTVTRAEGIISVLFIYYVIELARELDKEWGFVKIFRLLEGMIEYYLITNRDRPIYGEKALKNIENFEIIPNDVRTVCNGLRQYYRGSCKRAGLITKDLASLDKNTRKWCDEIAVHSIDSIKEFIEKLDDILQNDHKITPHSYTFTQRLHEILSSFIRVDKWADKLLLPLIGSKPEEQRFAQLCCNIRLKNNSMKKTIEEMMSSTSDMKQSEVPIREILQNIKKCEIFICWIYHIFYWLHKYNRKSLEIVFNELSPVKNNLIHAAIAFLEVPRIYWTDRYEELSKVAVTCINNYNFFIDKLLAYHKKVMKPRSVSPLLKQENGKLIVTEPLIGEYNLVEYGESIKHGSWLNDYYMWSVGCIYEQLKGVKL